MQWSHCKKKFQSSAMKWLAPLDGLDSSVITVDDFTKPWFYTFAFSLLSSLYLVEWWWKCCTVESPPYNLRLNNITKFMHLPEGLHRLAHLEFSVDIKRLIPVHTGIPADSSWFRSGSRQTLIVAVWRRRHLVTTVNLCQFSCGLKPPVLRCRAGKSS